MKNNKQAVSLIVLVITIIVMIILAGVIILSLNNSGIIDKAQDAVDKTNLNEVKNLAQIAWAEAYLNTGRTQEELETAVMDALEANKITEEDYKGYTIEVTTQGVNFVEKAELAPALNHSGIIPEGGIYYTGGVWNDEQWDWDYSNGVIYRAGEIFPETLDTGDKYVYGDYQYVYNCHFDLASYTFQPNESQNGWSVFAKGGKASYGTILETINNVQITNMDCTFLEDTNLVASPNIPSSVTSMNNTFSGCTALTDASNFVIPSGVTSMEHTFSGCTILTGTIEINANPSAYVYFLHNTTQPITLTGSSTMLEELAATAENGNVTVKAQ